MHAPPAPQLMRVVAPSGDPNGCCAGCCVDPTQNCCCPGAGCGCDGCDASDCGLQLPCDAACCGVGVTAVLLSAAAVLLAIVATPSLATIGPTGDYAALQAAVCAQLADPSPLSGCIVAASSTAIEPSKIAQALFGGIDQSTHTVYHVGSLSLTLAASNAALVAVYAFPAAVLWVVILAAVLKHCAYTELQVPEQVAVMDTPLPPPLAPQMHAHAWMMTLPPVTPTRPLELAKDKTYATAMVMWLPVAAALMLLLVLDAVRTAPVLELATGGAKPGPLRDLLFAFRLKYIVAATAAAVTVGFPVVRLALRLVLWAVLGLPWALYRFAGDRRVMHRVVKDDGAMEEDVCAVPCCIAVDMMCCPCTDIAGSPPQPSPSKGANPAVGASTARSHVAPRAVPERQFRAGNARELACPGLRRATTGRQGRRCGGGVPEPTRVRHARQQHRADRIRAGKEEEQDRQGGQEGTQWPRLW
jgi:hypothetical protein